MDLARARGFFAPFRGPWLRKADSRGLIDVLAAARKPCGLLLSPSPRRRAESQQSGIRRYSKLSKAPTSPSLPFAPASFDTCESRRGARRGGTGANRGFRSKSLRQSSAAGAGRCKLSTSNPRKMKGYHDIVGGGGSRILEQVAEQRARITDSLAGVRHLVAVGSGKGGVGNKHPDATSRERAARPGLHIAILDADSTVHRRRAWLASREQSSSLARTRSRFHGGVLWRDCGGGLVHPGAARGRARPERRPAAGVDAINLGSENVPSETSPHLVAPCGDQRRRAPPRALRAFGATPFGLAASLRSAA